MRSHFTADLAAFPLIMAIKQHLLLLLLFSLRDGIFSFRHGLCDAFLDDFGQVSYVVVLDVLDHMVV